MVYKILKGNHRAGWFFRLTRKNKISGTIKFLGDVSYFVDMQKDTNKIVGLSDNWYHHKDSVRLGWRFDSSRREIEIMTITYKKGIRFINHLCYCKDNEDYEYEIRINKGYYIYRFDTNISIVKRLSKWKFFRYTLFPFFGGREASPKNIYVKLEIDE